MKDHEKPEFHNALAALCASFGREPCTATVAAYWIATRDLPLSAVRLGFADAIRSAREFMPPAGAIRALAQTHIRIDPNRHLGPPKRPNLGDGGNGSKQHQFGHLTEADETKDEQRRKAAERESV